MGISLLFSTAMDNSGFSRGLASAEHSAKHTIDHINQHSNRYFMRRVSHMLGPAMLGFEAVAMTKEAMKGGKELQTEAMKEGLSVEDYQAVKIGMERVGDASKITAEEFVKLVDEIKASGEVISKEQVAKAANAADEWKTQLNILLKNITDPFVKFAGVLLKVVQLLSATEVAIFEAFQLRDPVKAFQTQIEKFIKQNEEAKAGTGIADKLLEHQTPEERAEKIREMQMKGAEKEKYGSQKTGNDSIPNPERIPSDALQKRGLFIGGVPIGFVNSGREHLQVLKQINTSIEKVDRSIREEI